jgi:predicted DNA-binding protein YlxM (UPF0122 family)
MYKFETEDELRTFISENMLATSEVTDLLGCTRQGVDDMIKRGKLTPLKRIERITTIFWKPDVLARIKR